MSEGTAERRAGLSQGRECRGRGLAPFARSPAAGCRQQALMQGERNIHQSDIKNASVFPRIRSEQVPSVVREVVSVAAWRRPGFGAADSAPKPAIRAVVPVFSLLKYEKFLLI